MCHHNRQLADLRHKEDAGNGQNGGVVWQYYGNGAEAGKGGEGSLRPYELPANIFQDLTIFEHQTKRLFASLNLE